MKHSYIIGAVMVVLMAVVFFIGFLGDDAVKAEETVLVTIDVDKKAEVAIIINKDGSAKCVDLGPSDLTGQLVFKHCDPPKKDTKVTKVKIKKITPLAHAKGSCYVCWEGDCYAC